MHIDYSDIGLDKNMQVIDGLASKPRNDVTGYQFQSNYERGAVRGFNMGAFTETNSYFDTYLYKVGTTGATYNDLGTHVLSLNLQKKSNILFMTNVDGGYNGTARGLVYVVMNVDGTNINPPLIFQGIKPSQDDSYVIYDTHSVQTVIPLSSGAHTTKLMYRVQTIDPIGTAEISTSFFCYLNLGG